MHAHTTLTLSLDDSPALIVASSDYEVAWFVHLCAEIDVTQVDE